MNKGAFTINQTTLKWVAIVSMLNDHVGEAFFQDAIIFRIIWRLAFPIFEFLVARGFKFTKHRGKYLARLLGFGVVAIYPYYLVFGLFTPNILFTFALSVMLMWSIDWLGQGGQPTDAATKTVQYVIQAFVVLLFALVATIFMFEYLFLGVLLPFVFWALNNHQTERYTAFVFLTILYTALSITSGITAMALIQLFSLFAILLLHQTTELQGKRKLKWFFYIFYPAHLLVLHIISLF